MKLKVLLKDLPDISVRGTKEIEITGITAHSQSVAPGNLFVAKKGVSRDGSQFIPQAVAAGAIAIVTDVYNPFLEGVTQVIHQDPNGLESLLANRFFSSPSKELFLVGITGTNGKTTTAYLIRHLFDHLQIKTGLIGTVEWIVGETILPAAATTPDLLTTQKLLREMVDCDSQAAVMEVSSHGLVQDRVDGLDFDVAVFTNLTQDHFDYHGTMEAYVAAKTKLFTMVEKVAIVNVDDPYANDIIAHCSAPIFTYGIENNADLRAKDIELTLEGVRATVSFQGETKELFSQLIGRFNVYNYLAAIALGISYGASLEQCTDALGIFSSVPGRMERVDNNKGVYIFVDYSHTEDSLKNALLTLKELALGRIFTVFGCGGDRDQDKRPKMGRVAERLSDKIIVTSDNPRTEDPNVILQQIVSGLKHPEKAHVDIRRKEAIHWAVDQAQKGDIVLIAGKGHETYQIFSMKTIAFDDRLVCNSTSRKKSSSWKS